MKFLHIIFLDFIFKCTQDIFCKLFLEFRDFFAIFCGATNLWNMVISLEVFNEIPSLIILDFFSKCKHL